MLVHLRERGKGGMVHNSTILRHVICAFALLVAIAFAQVSAEAGAQQYVVANYHDLVNGNYGSASTGATVALQGYNQPGDGGGGVLVSAPVSLSWPLGTCISAKGLIVTSGSNTITGISPFPIGLTIGMKVSGPGLPNGTTVTVTAYSVVGDSITVSTNDTTQTSQQGTYLFGLTANVKNEGMYLDGGGYCFTRANPTYSQMEFGAYSDGNYQDDDTSALQNWLLANQPHIAVAGNSIISNTLYCGVNANGTMITDGAVIQGPPPISVSETGAQPNFVITAADVQSAAGGTWSGAINAPMLSMGAANLLTEPLCSISAVGMVGTSTSQTPYDIIDAYAKHSAVLNHSQLAGGIVAFNCQQGGADIDLDDSSILNARQSDISSGCPNMKILRNVISGAGGDGIHTTSTQVLIEDNLIQQNGGNGVACYGNAVQLGIVGNYFDNNGLQQSGYNVYGNGCQVVSINGNQFHRSDPFDEFNQVSTAPSAHIHFDGANDSISLAGNVYFVGNDPNDPEMRPDYILELGPPTAVPPASITNFSFADSPTPQNGNTAPGTGVFGPTALAALGPFLPPNAQQNYLSGLVTTVSGQTFPIPPGIAIDSLGLQLLYLPATAQPPGCTVNPNNLGLTGLDGPGVPPYNIFVVAQGGNASATSCIGSNSTSPNFAATLNDQIAAYHAVLFGYLTSGQPYIINVLQCNMNNSGCAPTNNPFGGLAVGDTVTDATQPSNIPIKTTIINLKSQFYQLAGVAATAGSTLVQLPSPWSNPYPFVGQMIGNALGGREIVNPQTNSYVSAVVLNQGQVCTDSNQNTLQAPCFVMTQPANKSTDANNKTLVASGAFQITLSKNAQGSTSFSSPDTLYVWNDRYRLVAVCSTSVCNPAQSGAALGPTRMRNEGRNAPARH